jgi:hypothetical protein
MKNVFGFAIVVLFLLGPPNLFAQNEVPVPTFNNGDFWLFNVTEKDFQVQSTRALDGEFEVFYSGGKFLVRRPGGEDVSGLDIGEIRRMVNPNSEQQYTQFPLAVSKKWATNYNVQLRGNKMPVGRHADTNVTGLEEVATPAGKFRAFKIERYDTGGGGRNIGNFVYTYYYSPETRSLVKYHSEAVSKGAGASAGKTDIELIKFGSKLPK